MSYFTRVLLPLKKADGGWDEAKHQRDDKGRFAAMMGGLAADAKWVAHEVGSTIQGVRDGGLITDNGPKKGPIGRAVGRAFNKVFDVFDKQGPRDL